jgi:hypothetical protein
MKQTEVLKGRNENSPGQAMRKRAQPWVQRNKSASLPVDDSINLWSAKAKWPRRPMSEDHPGKSIPLLPQLIQHTVEKQRQGREFVRGSEEEKRLAIEVEELFANNERAVSALKSLFPEGVPTNGTFFERLNDLHLRLGWGEVSHRATGLLLSLAVDGLPENSAEALLDEMPRIGNPHFFQALESLSILVTKKALRPEYVAKWFPALVRRIGNDLASGGFWKAVGIYCEQRTASALEVSRCLSKGQNEEEISVAAYIIGTIRSLNLDGATLTQFKITEDEFSGSTTIGTKAIYHRSWIQTAWRGKMQKEDLNSLVSRLGRGVAEEQEQAFWIVCRSLLSPSIQPNCFDFGLEWLRTNVSKTISPASKYNIVDFAAQLPILRRREAAELVLLAQPILAEHKGIWARIEHFLVPWLQTDLPGFCDFCLELAKANARNWLEVLKAPQSFDWFLSELQNKDIGNLVGQLVLSTSVNCRKLGLFLFDELEMNALPTTMLDAVGEDSVKIAFYEFQRSLMDGHALARYLIMLIPCVQRKRHLQHLWLSSYGYHSSDSYDSYERF